MDRLNHNDIGSRNQRLCGQRRDLRYAAHRIAVGVVDQGPGRLIVDDAIVGIEGDGTGAELGGRQRAERRAESGVDGIVEPDGIIDRDEVGDVIDPGCRECRIERKPVGAVTAC